MLKRKSAIFVLAALALLSLALAASFAFSFSLPSSSPPDSLASAASISPASSFNYLPNGTQYQYTGTNAAATAVTVSSSETKGSLKNPHVIHTKEQWQFFTNLITANNSAYNSSSVYFYIDNDIDFSSYNITPAGVNIYGFKAHLFGGKHQLKNAKIGTVTAVSTQTNVCTKGVAAGLFYYINGGYVHDLQIASSCTYSFVPNNHAVIGGITAYYAGNSVLVNCVNNANITVDNSATDGSKVIELGGIVGATSHGVDFNSYYNSYKGTITVTACKNGLAEAEVANNSIRVGGIIGHADGSTNFVGNLVKVSAKFVHGGINYGGLYGQDGCENNLEAVFTRNIQTCVVDTAMNFTGTQSSADISSVGGYSYGRPTKVTLSNLYVLNRGTSGGVLTESTLLCSYSSTTAANNVVTNVVVNTETSDYTVTKVASVNDVLTKAKANSTIMNVFTTQSDGSLTPKLNATYKITYNIGSGATWGSSTMAPSTYANSTAIQSLAVSTSPTRTGYNLKGWSLISATSSSYTSGKLSIPANQTGDIIAYAVWELQAFSGSPSNVSVTYGSDATLSASGVSHPAGTANANYGVNLSYQWKNSSGTVLGTGSTYKITKPSYTAGTNYTLVVTATPKDGVTPAKSQNFTVKLVVNRQGVAAPTVATGLVYNGQSQTGVSASSSLVSFSGTTSSVNAGSFTATASLPNGNYCWGSSGGSDTGTKTLNWSIAKATVAVPTITAGKSQVYTGSTLKPTTSTNSLYTVTNNGGTDVGNYTVTFNLANTGNYKWATTPTGGTESGAYTLSWSITKANVTLTAPSFTSNADDPTKLYVGQTVANLTIDQGSGTHVRAGSTTNVPGTYAWTPAGSTRIAEDMTSIGVTFTPNDTKNYNTATVSVPVAPIQLYLNVNELKLVFLNAEGGAVDLTASTPIATQRTITSMRRDVAAAVSLKVDYGKAFDLSLLRENKTINTTVVDSATLAWQLPTGYSVAFYGGINSVTNEGVSQYSGNYTSAIKADLTVYLGYVANEVEYTVVTVFQHVDGQNGTPSNADVIAYLANPGDSTLQAYKDTMVIETAKANSGSRVSYSARTDTTGFTRKNSLASSDSARTFESQDQSRFVLGTGNTVIVTYYERNTYTVSWTFTEGQSKTADGTALTAGRYTARFIYGAPFVNIANPWYGKDESDNEPPYTFTGWFTDNALTLAFDVPKTMPASNLTLYAGRSAKQYTATFNYNWNNHFNDSFNIPKNYQTANPNLPSADSLTRTYTVEQIVNTGVIRFTTPTIPGLRFLYWAYDGPDGKPVRINNIAKTTARDYTLYAVWDKPSYRITLNTNGGERFSPSYINQFNLTVWDDKVAGYNSEQDSSVPDGFYLPTRAGYTFMYWGYVDSENGNELSPIVSGNDYNYMIHGTTLYAVWRARPVLIEYAIIDGDEIDTSQFDIIIKSSDATDPDGTPNPDREFGIEETWYEELLFKDSILTITVIPNSGYEVNYITISGVSFNNGGVYTVRTYDEDKMVLNVQLNAKRYNITYVWDGGSFVGDAEHDTYPRTFTVSDTVDIVGNKLVSKLGYVFAGWHIGSKDSNRIAGDPAQDIFAEDGSRFGAYNTVLYATWTPAPEVMVYHNNRLGTNGAGEFIERIETSDKGTILTGDTITLFDPTNGDERFIPANSELIGWATSPDGDIVYNVGYQYVVNGEESHFVPQPVDYTVKVGTLNGETGKLENHLYAVWRVTNAQYVAFESANNNRYFDAGDDYTGVTLTARPRYTYQQDENLKLKFSWYKVDPSNPIWVKWTEDDLEGKKEGTDEYNQILANIGMYKIPSTVSPVWQSDTLTNLAPVDQKHSYTLYNVNDSGLYIVKLEAEGSYRNQSGSLKRSSIEMYGQYEVIINKANLETIVLTSSDPEHPALYNGQPQGIEVTMPVTVVYPLQSDGTYLLPDGSKLKITYTYITTDENGDDVKIVGKPTNVGAYRVEASFSFVDDKGNYNVPDTLNGTFDITFITIDDVDFAIQLWNGTEWVAAEVVNTFNRNQFRVVATPKNLVEGDENYVSIQIYYDGMDENHYQAPVNVGKYVAYCDGLVAGELGDRSMNYALSGSLPTQAFEIIKADRDLSFVAEDKTVTYNEQLQKWAIDKILEGAHINDQDALVGGTVVEILPGDTENTDKIVLADGSVLTLTYEQLITPAYVNSVYSPDSSEEKSSRGGIHAGVYEITVNFAESSENVDNYNQLESLTFNLTIEQAPYKADGTNVGLSDAQLNKYVTDEEGNYLDKDGNVTDEAHRILNVNGFAGVMTVNFDGQKFYKPQLNLETKYFSVTYKYTKVTTGKEEEITLGQGLHDAGVYHVTAEITYVDQQYANDYQVLRDVVYELSILPGELVGVKVTYDQAALETIIKTFDTTFSGYRYGSGFDFYELAGSGYVVKIEAEYNSNGTPSFETVDNNKAQFYKEDLVDGQLVPFDKFDKATILGETLGGTAIDGSKQYYTIKVGVYGYTQHLGDLQVEVRQAELANDSLGFDMSDSNTHKTSGQWSYGFTYDGETRYPEVDSSITNSAFNYVGIDTDELKGGIAGTDSEKDADVVAKYTYVKGSTWSEADKQNLGKGFTDAGSYVLRVDFENKNTNYKSFAETNNIKTQLESKVNVLSRSLKDSDIIWQYCNNAQFADEDTKTLEANANLVYQGTGGYYVRAVFRNLSVKNANEATADNPYYFNVTGLSLNNGEATDKVHIINADEYSISIKELQANSTNYAEPDNLDAKITIEQASVNLTWGLTDGVSVLTYTGSNQLNNTNSSLSSVTAHYTPTLPGTSEQAVTIKVATYNGEKVDEDKQGQLINAGAYSLTAEITGDTNFKPSNPTFLVTVNPKQITDSNAISWYRSEVGGDAISSAYKWVYAGVEQHIYAEFATIGDDSGSGNGKIRVEATDATGAVPKNAGEYTLSVKYDAKGAASNYDLSSVTYKIDIAKATSTVDWLDSQKTYEYDGTNRVIEAEALGVGDESEANILVLSNATQRNASNSYYTYATVAEQYANNYVLTGEDVGSDGSVGWLWSISRRKVSVNWKDTDKLVYNNGFALPDMQYELGNLVKIGEEDGVDQYEHVELSFEILRNAESGPVKVPNMTVAGSYTLKVVGISDNNYSFEDIIDETVVVNKAKPAITNVVYKEYANADGVTYQGNSELRADKIVYESAFAGVNVPGVMKFADEKPNLSVATYYDFAIVFTPTDTANYEVVNLTVGIEIKVDSIVRIGFDKSTIASIYAVGQSFSGKMILARFEYYSYYEEVVDNKIVQHGKFINIDDNDTLTFMYNNRIMEGAKYQFKESDLDGSETSVEKIINVFADNPTTGKTVRGEIKVILSNAIPLSISILNKEELENGTYYVGSTFDKSIVQFYVEYETASSNGVVDSTLVDVQNPALTQVGTQDIVFTYFTGGDAECRVTLRINVSAKLDVAVADPSGTYRYTGEAIDLKSKLKLTNGDALPEDVTYSITDDSGNPVALVEAKTYSIIIKFAAPEYKYNAIADVTATIEIKVIVAELDPNQLREPSANRVYTGNALTEDDYILRGIAIVNLEDSSIQYKQVGETVYTVNGRPAKEFDIREAGVYNFVATLVVFEVGNEDSEFTITHSYTIEIEQATNEISVFTVNTWIYGVGAGQVTFNSLFGEPVIEYYRLNSETDEIGTTVGYTLPTEIGRYRAEATVIGTPSYTGVTEETTFSITKPVLNTPADVNGEPMKDETGKDKVQVSASNGVNPFYNLRVELIKDTSDVTIKNQVIVVGYDVDIVNASNEIVQNTGEYTVKLLLTEEQRDTQNYKNPKVYLVDEYGVVLEEITNAHIDEDGYMVFTTSNFNGNFIVSAQDAVAIAQMWWIIGLSIGGLIALIAIIILIVVIVKKKKKEND